MSNSGLAAPEEDVIETVFRMLRASGRTEAANLLRNGRRRFEETGYDNWNGGTRIFTLYIEIAHETYAILGDRKTEIKNEIEKFLTDGTGSLSTDWYNVELVPLIVAIPSRPDLQGGPVSALTRKNIVRSLRKRNLSWHGELLETEFLSEIFDLEKLPTNDARFKNAAGDIWQHRINNDDWPDDWVFKDERLNLLQGPDAVFLQFVERLVDPMVRPDQPEASALAAELRKELLRDGWTLDETDTLSGERKFRVTPANAAYDRAEAALRHTAMELSSAWMHQEIERLEAAIDVDPALAIGTAKEVIETCCKHIAERLALTIPLDADMPQLVKATLTGLQLVPENISEEKKGAQAIKRILGNLAQVTHGLAELRNLYGSGHGRNSSHRGLQPRHARLAVSAAATLVEFLVATFNIRAAEISRPSKT
jgi:AbiJ N-terminal domain 3/Abortive infection C-terminus